MNIYSPHIKVFNLKKDDCHDKAPALTWMTRILKAIFRRHNGSWYHPQSGNKERQLVDHFLDDSSCRWSVGWSSSSCLGWTAEIQGVATPILGQWAPEFFYLPGEVQLHLSPQRPGDENLFAKSILSSKNVTYNAISKS